MIRRALAFTLIEILVALLIIAIACSAVIKAMSDGILVSSHLQRSLVSRWVASNVLAQLQNGMLPSLRSNSDQSGSVDMWHQKWAWHAVASADSAYYQQVTISVGPNANKLTDYHLYGFVWQQPTSRRAGS